MADISVLRGTFWGMIVLGALVGGRPATAAAGRSETDEPTAGGTPIELCRVRFEQARAEVAATWPAIGYARIEARERDEKALSMAMVKIELWGAEEVRERGTGRVIETISPHALVDATFSVCPWDEGCGSPTGWMRYRHSKRVRSAFTPEHAHLVREYSIAAGRISAGGPLPAAKVRRFVAVFKRAIDDCAVWVATSKRPTAELEAKAAGPELAMLPDDAPPTGMCVDLDRARGKSLRLGYLDRDVGRGPHRQRPSKRALSELAALDSSRLPGWGQGEAEVVGVAVGDTNRDGTYELYVEYRVSRANSAQQAFNIAALSLPDHRLLWASTTDYHAALPREQTCSGLVQVLDVDCDQISDIVIFRTCHDTMCPRNDSPDAECHGNTTARDIAHLWDPAGRVYRTRSPIKTRDASNDCGAHDTPVILCPPPERPVRR